MDLFSLRVVIGWFWEKNRLAPAFALLGLALALALTLPGVLVLVRVFLFVT